MSGRKGLLYPDPELVEGSLSKGACRRELVAFCRRFFLLLPEVSLVNSIRPDRRKVRQIRCSQRRHWGPLFGLIVAILSLAELQTAAAASVDVYGVPVRVDAVEKLEGGMVRISIFGNDHIVGQEEVSGYVLQAYASSRTPTALSVKDLESIIRGALGKGDLKGATDAFILLLSNTGFQIGEEEVFFSSIQGVSHFSQLLRNVLLSATSDPSGIRGDAVALLLLKAGASDIEWARQNGIRLAYRFSQDFKECFRNAFVRSFSGEGVDPDRIVELLAALFGETDEDVRDLRAVLLRVKSMQAALKTRNLSDVLSVLGKYDTSARRNFLISAIVTEIIYNESDRLIGQRAFSDVLLLLSRVDFNKRTPHAHALILEALKGLSMNEYVVLSNRNVQDMLGFYSAQDSALRDAYVDVLDRRAWDLVEGGNPFAADEPLNQLLLFRPDPHRANDAIRLAQTREYLKIGRETLAVERLASLRTGIPVKDRLWFAWYRLIYKTSIWTFLFLLGVVAATLFGVRKYSRIREKERRERWRALGWNDYTQAGISGRPFVMKELRSHVDPVLQEYYDCLQVFELTPGASARDVKSAYRKKMKEVHPDLNIGDEEGSSREFIRIRKAYERLLAMEKESVPLQFRQ